jgi:hypothetical protein
VSLRRSAFSLLIPTFALALLAAAPAPAAAQPEQGYSAIDDFTGDGLADIVDHWGANGNFYIRRNYGNGTFEAPGTFWGSGTTASPLGVNGNGWTILTGDFTGDGWADYADYHRPSGQIWIHENLKNGSFGGTWGYGDLPDGTLVVAADIDQDGRTDLFHVDNFYFRYWRNQGAIVSYYASPDPLYWMPGQWLNGNNRVAFGDFDGDHCDDIVLSNVGTDGWFRVYQSRCNFLPGGYAGFYSTPLMSAQGVGHPSIVQVFGDFNGDGLADYADVHKDTGEIWWHANLGPGVGFSPVHSAYGLYSSTPGWSILGFPVFFF